MYSKWLKIVIAMDFVVDFQCFKSIGNNYIVKELSVVRIHGDKEMHFLLKPPQPYFTLTPQMKKRVNFLTRHIHGLRWDSGELDSDDVLAYVADVLNLCANTVYIKGSERVKFMENMLHPRIVVRDLDHFMDDCDTTVKVKCENHVNKTKRCSLSKALSYKAWLLTHGY